MTATSVPSEPNMVNSPLADPAFTPQMLPENNPLCNHWVLDLETLAINPRAAIIEIGLVNVGMPECRYHKLINPKYYQHEPGFVIDDSTIEFHRGLGIENAYDAACKEGIVNYTQMLDVIKDLICILPWESVIWCQGTDFDIPIITNLFRFYGNDLPWKYSNVRDARTLIKLMHPGYKSNPGANGHRAIEDCLWTRNALLECKVNLC